MGNVTSKYSDVKTYTVPLNPKKILDEDAAETGIFRSALLPTNLMSDFSRKKIKTAWNVFMFGRSISKDNDFLGTRKLLSKDKYGEYEYMTYDDVYHNVKKIGSAIIKLGLVESTEFPDEIYEKAKKLKILGLCSVNRSEWFILDYVCHAYGFCSVPLYTTLGSAGIKYMVDQCKMQTIFGSEEGLLNVLNALLVDEKENTKTTTKFLLKQMIHFDEIGDELRDLARSFNIKLLSWDHLLKEGENEQFETIEVDPLSIGTICYTSGTTGDPKGVLITEQAFASQAGGALKFCSTFQGLYLSSEDVYISYLPLSHVFERALCIILCAKGAKIAFSTGLTANLLEDIKAARPTIFASVPRLFVRINDKISINLAKSNFFVKFLFNWGMNAKIQKLRNTGDPKHFFWDKVLLKDVRELLGGRIRYMLSGGAALEKSLQEKMACLFCCPLLEGYGLTETFGASCIRRGDDSEYGHFGMNLPMNEIKLVSIPEMGYYVGGKEMVGELAFRGHTVFKGYFRNKEKTKEVLDQDGWFYTGDIVVRMNESGRLKIFDRKKNLFKLSQGEYVSPEKIEGILTQSPLIAQAFVYGKPFASYLIAIIVVDDEIALPLWKEENKLSDLTTDEIISNHYELLYSDIKKEIDELAQKHDLKGFERVKRFYMTFDKLTEANFCITPTMKLKRRVINQKYAAELDALYQE